tara:strand:- start:21418 stop:21564 length:147 start_codon:yes stop_codon:yes gene_type:complete
LIYLGRRYQSRDFAEAAVRADSGEGVERAQSVNLAFMLRALAAQKVRH